MRILGHTSDYLLYSGKVSREKTHGLVRGPFHGENFRGMLKIIIGGYDMPKFRGENFRGWLSSCEIHENILPQKFFAIQYHNTTIHVTACINFI